jgi:hypothetical protein
VGDYYDESEIRSGGGGGSTVFVWLKTGSNDGRTVMNPRVP